MQFLMIVLSVTTAGFCYDGNLHGPELPGWSPVDAAIQFQVLNTYNITWAYHALGLASWEGGGDVTIIFVNSMGGELNSLDPGTGGGAGAVPKPAGSGYGFGVAYNGDPDDPYWMINSWQNSNLYYTEDQFGTWQTTGNPAGSNGRGMSCDGEYYWQSNSTGLIRFTPGGAGTSFPDMAPNQISGVTVVPGDDPSHTYVMVTTYNTDIFVLYEYDGSGMTQVATGVTPSSLGVNSRLGLCWCNARNSLFFSYDTSSGYRISELSFQVVSLSRDTWAGIKNSF